MQLKILSFYFLYGIQFALPPSLSDLREIRMWTWEIPEKGEGDSENFPNFQLCSLEGHLSTCETSKVCWPHDVQRWDEHLL